MGTLGRARALRGPAEASEASGSLACALDCIPVPRSSSLTDEGPACGPGSSMLTAAFWRRTRILCDFLAFEITGEGIGDSVLQLKA